MAGLTGTPNPATFLAPTPPALTAARGTTQGIGTTQATTGYQIWNAVGSGCTHIVATAYWDRLQSGGAGTALDSTQMAALNAEISTIVAAGGKPILEHSLHYPPSWVMSAVEGFKDQSGNVYAGSAGTGNQVANWMWTSSGRGYVSDFLTKVYAGLTSSNRAAIDRIRFGGGVYGELHYPTAFLASPNSYWGYGTSMQTGTGLASGLSACPHPGYTLFSGNSTYDTDWINWYIGGLSNWLTWTATQLSGLGWTCDLMCLHPGYGIRSNQLTSDAGYRSSMAAGEDPATMIAAYAGNSQVWPWCTWIDGADGWVTPTVDSDQAPWKKIYAEAWKNSKHTRLWGENTGGEANAAMNGVFHNALTQGRTPTTGDPIYSVTPPAAYTGYTGMMWLDYNGLTAGTGGATLANLSAWATFPTTKTYLRGVNDSGGEFTPANVPGTYGTDYQYDGAPTVRYLAGRGHQLLRLPFLWERIQPTLSSALSTTEVTRITNYVQQARLAGCKVILDVHNYGRYTSGGTTHVLGDGTLTQAHLVDLWTRISAAFKGMAGVGGYALMNEPHDLPGVAGGYGASNTLYTFDSSAQGWVEESGLGSVTDQSTYVHDGANALQITKTLSSGVQFIRANDAANNTAVIGNGQTLGLWVLVPSGTSGSWLAHIEMQNSSYTWQAGADVAITPGTWTLLTYTPSSGIWSGHHGLGVQFTGTTTGGSFSVVIDTMTQGTISAGLTAAQQWEQAAQACVTAIRGNSDTTLITVGGYNWSSADTWPTNHPAPFITDPAANILYEGHTYFDDNESGVYASSFASETTTAAGEGYNGVAARVRSRLANFTDWCVTNKVGGYVGEIGWPHGSDATNWNAVGTLIYKDLGAANQWATYWSVGEFWGTSYALSAYDNGGTGPVNAADAQAPVIEAFESITLLAVAVPATVLMAGPANTATVALTAVTAAGAAAAAAPTAQAALGLAATSVPARSGAGAPVAGGTLAVGAQSAPAAALAAGPAPVGVLALGAATGPGRAPASAPAVTAIWQVVATTAPAAAVAGAPVVSGGAALTGVTVPAATAVTSPTATGSLGLTTATQPAATQAAGPTASATWSTTGAPTPTTAFVMAPVATGAIGVTAQAGPATSTATGMRAVGALSLTGTTTPAGATAGSSTATSVASLAAAPTPATALAGGPAPAANLSGVNVAGITAPATYPTGAIPGPFAYLGTPTVAGTPQPAAMLAAGPSATSVMGVTGTSTAAAAPAAAPGPSGRIGATAATAPAGGVVTAPAASGGVGVTGGPAPIGVAATAPTVTALAGLAGVTTPVGTPTAAPITSGALGLAAITTPAGTAPNSPPVAGGVGLAGTTIPATSPVTAPTATAVAALTAAAAPTKATPTAPTVTAALAGATLTGTPTPATAQATAPTVTAPVGVTAGAIPSLAPATAPATTGLFALTGATSPALVAAGAPPASTVTSLAGTPAPVIAAAGTPTATGALALAATTSPAATMVVTATAPSGAFAVTAATIPATSVATGPATTGGLGLAGAPVPAIAPAAAPTAGTAIGVVGVPTPAATAIGAPAAVGTLGGVSVTGTPVPATSWAGTAPTVGVLGSSNTTGTPVPALTLVGAPAVSGQVGVTVPAGPAGSGAAAPVTAGTFGVTAVANPAAGPATAVTAAGQVGVIAAGTPAGASATAPTTGAAFGVAGATAAGTAPVTAPTVVGRIGVTTSTAPGPTAVTAPTATATAGLAAVTVPATSPATTPTAAALTSLVAVPTSAVATGGTPGPTGSIGVIAAGAPALAVVLAPNGTATFGLVASTAPAKVTAGTAVATSVAGLTGSTIPTVAPTGAPAGTAVWQVIATTRPTRAFTTAPTASGVTAAAYLVWTFGRCCAATLPGTNITVQVPVAAVDQTGAVSVTANLPAPQWAFTALGQRPSTWTTGAWTTVQGVPAVYRATITVGPSGTVLPPGRWVAWVKVTSIHEVPVAAVGTITIT